MFSLVLFASISTFSFSQKIQPHKTDVNKDIDVVLVYEQVVREGYGTAFIYEKLATAYYFKNEYGKALTWFQKLFEVEKNTNPDLTTRYNQTLKAIAANNSESSENKSVF